MMCGLKFLTVVLVTVFGLGSTDRQIVSALPVPHIIDAPRAHSGSDIPAALEGKAKALLDEEGQLGTYDLANMITDEHDVETVLSHFLSQQEAAHVDTPKKKRRHHHHRHVHHRN